MAHKPKNEKEESNDIFTPIPLHLCFDGYLRFIRNWNSKKKIAKLYYENCFSTYLSGNDVDIKHSVYCCIDDLGLLNPNEENQKCFSFSFMRRFLTQNLDITENENSPNCMTVYRIKFWLSKKREESEESDVEDDSELKAIKDSGNLLENAHFSEKALVFIATIIYKTFKNPVTLNFLQIKTQNYYYIIATDYNKNE